MTTTVTVRAKLSKSIRPCGLSERILLLGTQNVTLLVTYTILHSDDSARQQAVPTDQLLATRQQLAAMAYEVAAMPVC
jgi:hypothetical protein